jgi:hypothetical protein
MHLPEPAEEYTGSRLRVLPREEQVYDVSPSILDFLEASREQEKLPIE